ncbi:rhodanese-like domain-containing protein [Streptomyces sp. C10-9-1]|uniref:rhodanese-like domain-containing protein n=1 Tax=Streptomyces sp. C10-9-1 TaxID=1859285 RepID=UPI003D733B9E
MFLSRRNTPRLSVGQAYSRTRGDRPGAVLLDVREAPEWSAGHAPGAVHAALTDLVAGASLPRAAQELPLVVICRSGRRSQRAAQLLVERGAEAVDVEGGMNAWASAGYPVVDERGNSGRIA